VGSTPTDTSWYHSSAVEQWTLVICRFEPCRDQVSRGEIGIRDRLRIYFHLRVDLLFKIDYQGDAVFVVPASMMMISDCKGNCSYQHWKSGL